MSRYTVELPKEVAASWRKHLGTSHGQFGIDWLRQNSPRAAAGDTGNGLIESALVWKGYQMALDDLEDKLTIIKQREDSLEEEPLETPEPRR